MTVTFESLTTTVTIAMADGGLFLFGAGSSEVLEADEARGDGFLLLGGEAYGEVYSFDVDPEIPVYGDGALLLAGEGEGFVRITGEADGGMALGGEAYAIDTPGAPPAGVVYGFGEGSLLLSGEGFEIPRPTAYGLLYDQYPLINGLSGAYFENLEDALILNTQLDSRLDYVLTSIMRMGDRVGVLGVFTATVNSSLIARDFVSVILDGEVADSLILTDLPTSVLRMIGVLADQLVMADESLGYFNALVTVVSALVLRDRAVIGLDGRIEDDLILTDDVEALVRTIVTLVSNLLLADETEAVLHMFAVLEDSFQFADQTTVTAAMLAELLDTVSFGVRVRAGDELIVGYSLNTRIGAVSEYDNWPFTSMAVIGGKPYGAGPDGIYRLEGDDDNGDPIAAHVRTGLLNFQALTRVPNAWIGYTSSGELVLKVVTTDKGFKKENQYRMKARPGGSAEETRFDIAKGLIGTYWAFEIENLDGADFELDIVKVWPLRTQRRYSGR